MNPMNLKRRLTAGVLLGVAFIALEFFVHGFLLSGMYKETASVWRLQAEMKDLFGLMIAGQFLFGVFFGIVFAQGYEPRRGALGQGFRYGLIMGSMLAPMNSLGWYVILPIPAALAVCWLVAGFVEMVALGIVASFVYKP
jgi:hypothetical protein